MRDKRKLKLCVKALLFFTPFIVGSIGYLKSGEGLSQSLYSAIGLYLLDFYGEECNRLLEFARWTAPVMSASGIFLILKSLAQRTRDFILCLFGKATAIYCEDEVRQILGENIKNSVIGSKENVHAGVKDNIIMLSDDMESLNFYYTNQKKFENSNVYLRLEQIDSFLLKENRIKFFNETELIARNYWKEHNLLKYLHDDSMNIKIAIIGFEQLGQKLLSFGLMNNIYARNQKIEYHVWGDSSAYENVFSQIDFMNGDFVTYHGDDWSKDLNSLGEFDRVIVTQENQLELVQALLYICMNAEIDYYNKGEAMLENIFAGSRLRAFGTQANILTEKNIMSEELCRFGMELNYAYYKQYAKENVDVEQKETVMKELWESLDGFTKASNIASADYHEIRLMILDMLGKQNDDFSEDEKKWLSKAEHIRWSRFHLLNHWTYQPEENGQTKNKEKRTHSCLIPYEELSEKEKEKDWGSVLTLMSLKNLNRYQ